VNPYTVTPYLRSFPLEPAEPPEDLSWQDLALCAEVGDDFWFPEKGGSTREAKRVCRSCEVRAECLAYALEHEDAGRFGIWGGFSERERRRLKRNHPPGSPSPQPRKAVA
jgi:WhiB family redox-sensing transcriptional regulator